MQHISHIRPFNQNDKIAVLELLRLNTPAYFSPEEEKDLLFYLENEIEEYFVLEVDNKIIGCGGINYSSDKTIGKISWDIFHPDFQGKGYGSLLINHRLEILKNRIEIEQIIVRTSQLAYKFYEKTGFKLINQSKDFWAIGYDMYEMEFEKRNLNSN